MIIRGGHWYKIDSNTIDHDHSTSDNKTRLTRTINTIPEYAFQQLIIIN